MAFAQDIALRSSGPENKLLILYSVYGSELLIYHEDADFIKGQGRDFRAREINKYRIRKVTKAFPAAAGHKGGSYRIYAPDGTQKVVGEYYCNGDHYRIKYEEDTWKNSVYREACLAGLGLPVYASAVNTEISKPKTNWYSYTSGDPVNKWDPSGLRAIVANDAMSEFSEWWTGNGMDNWGSYRWGQTLNKEGYSVGFSWNPFQDFQTINTKFSEVYPSGQLDLSSMSEKERMFAFMAADPDHTYVFEKNQFGRAGWREATDDDSASFGIATRDAVYPRLNGAVKVLGGTAEVFAGTALTFTPEPTMITKVAGPAAILHGTDFAASGLRETIYGQPQRTLTSTGIGASLQALGVDPSTALKVAEGADVVLSLGSLGYASYAYFANAGRTSMIGGSTNEANQFWSYSTRTNSGSSAFTVDSRVYLTKHAPGNWLYEKGAVAGLRRVARTGQWSPYTEGQHAIFTTGKVSAASAGISPLRHHIPTLWKQGQYTMNPSIKGFAVTGAEDGKFLLDLSRPILGSPVGTMVTEGVGYTIDAALISGYGSYLYFKANGQ